MKNQMFFGEHFSRRNQLMDLLDRTQGIFNQLNMGEEATNLETLSVRLKQDTFKIMVVGEFKRGKSTFINALLGEKLLPATSVPCTAVITEVKWGDNKEALLYFRQPLPEPLSEGLPPTVVEYLAQHHTDSLPPMKINAEELNDYVKILDPAKDQKRSVAQTPYAKVDIMWPLPLCANGIEIIDSPGLNEHGARTKITSEYLRNTDAVLFVMSCIALAGESEMNFINNYLHNSGHENIFFLCNRINQVEPDEDKQTIIDYGINVLEDKTALGRDGIFFFSALDALEGRLDNDEERIRESGILDIETNLTRFLVEQRGKIKLLQPANNLKQLIQKAQNEVIPTQYNMLEQDITSLQAKYEEVKPLFEDAERKRQQIMGKINVGCADLKDDVRRQAKSWVDNTVHQIPDWIIEMEIENSLELWKTSDDSAIPIGHKKQAENLIHEVAEKLIERLENEYFSWCNNDLQPFVTGKINTIFDDTEVNIQSFLIRIQEIRQTIAGISNTEKVSLDQASGIERILAAAGGLMVGGVGSAFVGGTFGYKEMAKSLVPNVAVGLVLILGLGVINPAILIPALLGTGLVQNLWTLKRSNDKIVSEIANQIALELKTKSEDIANKIAEFIEKEIMEIAQPLEQGMAHEINSIREQVEVALKEKETGEAYASAKRELLKQIEKELTVIQQDLSNLLLLISI